MMKCKALQCLIYTSLLQCAAYAQSNTSFLNSSTLLSDSTQYENTIEFGLGNINQDSFDFGEYSGLEAQGGFIIGNLFLNNAAWTLKGLNLGLDSRSVFAEYHEHASFKLTFDYDQLPHYRQQDASTPFLGAGTSRQTLPTNWIAANTTIGMTNLQSNLTFHNLETERQRFASGFSWLPADKWEFTGRFQHEVKEGRDALSGIFGTNGGNPRGAHLIQAIDYAVDDYTVSLGYADRNAQFSVAYHLSLFNNENNYLQWSNPFLRLPVGNTWAPGTDYAAGAIGQLSVMPDNQAQQITVNGAYAFANSAHLNANISVGQMQQDAAYLPYTLNSALNVPTALPRSQLDGEIETLFATLGFSMRPARKLNIRANYTFDNRDNNTPRDLYLRVRSDSGNQGGLLSADARINTPYGFETQKLNIEAAYRLASAHKLVIGVEQENRDRTYTEVETTKELTTRIKLQSRLSESISGHIEVARSDREGSEYISNSPYLDSYNPNYIATLPANNRYINDPLLRKFNYADRLQDKIATTINIIASESTTLGISAQRRENDYQQSRLGLQKSEETSATLDMSYVASTTLDSYLFFTRENMNYLQAGYQRAATTLYPGIIREPALCASCGFWNVEMDDDIDTAGTGLNWKTWEEKLKLAIAYTYSTTKTKLLPNADANISYAALPEVNTRWQSLNLTADYQIKENMSMRMRYLYQKEKMQDFAVDNTSPATLNNIILLGSSPTDYSGSVMGVSLVYRY